MFHTDFTETDERQAEFGRKKQVLKAAYANEISVSEVKKTDLVGLCKKKVIPQSFHHEYKSFKTSKGVKEVFHETDEDEEAREEDESSQE